MVVGICRIVLHLPGNHSLKGKRHVVKSLIGRVRHQFNVAIAEVDQLDQWQLATLGIACVSNESQHASEMLSKVVSFIEASRAEAEVTDYEIDLIPA
ncbi:MAG: DUF503 domain-containing protein [Chloroflexi bacterium]|nr:DUF503 domain-containing protein [Chloroflexota bacterium]